MAEKEWTIADSIADIQAVQAADDAKELMDELTDFALNLSRLVDRSFCGPKHQEVLVYAPYQPSLDGKSVEIPAFAGLTDYVITISRNEKS